MSTDIEGRIEGDGYYALWRRNDRAWGHSIEVDLFDLGGARFGDVSFACHPEFTDYERYQSMNTGELVQIVSERLRVAMREVYVTEPDQPPGEKPHGYDIRFTPYDENA